MVSRSSWAFKRALLEGAQNSQDFVDTLCFLSSTFKRLEIMGANLEVGL